MNLKQCLKSGSIMMIASTMLSLSAQAAGKGGGGGSTKWSLDERAEQREHTRWTLSEWLEQRDRSHLMDLWLSMNSPSPFEFMLGGAYVANKTTSSAAGSTDLENTSYMGELRAYAQFVGLTVEHHHNAEENLSDTSGMINLRLLGNSLQNSSLTVHFGQRSRIVPYGFETATYRNLFSQVSLQVYIAKYFGIDGYYRYFEPSRNETIQQNVGGSLAEGGLFIDFAAIRVYGGVYKDTQQFSEGNSDAITTRQGIKGGIKIFY